MHTRAWMAIGIAALVAVSCSTASRSGSRSTGDRITADEIASANVRSAFDAVRRLRPFWLRPSPITNPPVVYVDNIRLGGPDALHDVSAQEVVEIRHMSAPDATTRYGTGHDGGAILVFTRR